MFCTFLSLDKKSRNIGKQDVLLVFPTYYFALPMSTSALKKYGLILKKPSELPKPIVKPVAAAFASDDDDGIEIASSSEITSSTVRAKMQAKREHEKALAEDPTIFDYDNIYEELTAEKNQKIAKIKAADKERKSKYAEQILETHKKRLLAQQSREERKQQKEREAEAGQFDDKEKFVTSAYKKQLAEMENFRLQEAIDSRFDELTAVEKQKGGMWKGGFYRTLLSDIARDNNTVKSEEKSIKLEVDDSDEAFNSVNPQQAVVDPNEHDKKFSSLRNDSSNDDRFSELAIDKPVKKLMYSDDSDEELELNSAISVNLKPGLNILKPRVKKPTKAEQIRRHFTPSPEHTAASSSSSEEVSKEREKQVKKQKHDRKYNHRKQWREKSTESHNEKKSSGRHRDKSHEHRSMERKEHKKSDEKQKVGKEESDESKKQTMKEKTKEERLEIIKTILAHRNNSEKIEEIRQRYLERKKGKIVPLPF
ncbi:Nuclear speckle splicing regulatory protein [Dirofilaria immitis]